MKMVFRWYGEGNDTVTLEQIRQIPGVEGIVWALHHLPAGEEWPLEDIVEVKRICEKHGFHIDVVESVNIHEDIKLGLPSRDLYIERYKRTIENLAKAGVKVICYNFMPVFDWLRTDLYKEAEDGSTALFYEHAKVDQIDPFEIVDKIANNVEFTMPGWEPERLEHLTKLFEAYQNVTEDDLWNHLHYFLEQIIPTAARRGIKMAIHPMIRRGRFSGFRASSPLKKASAGCSGLWTIQATASPAAARLLRRQSEKRHDPNHQNASRSDSVCTYPQCESL